MTLTEIFAAATPLLVLAMGVGAYDLHTDLSRRAERDRPAAPAE